MCGQASLSKLEPCCDRVNDEKLLTPLCLGVSSHPPEKCWNSPNPTLDTICTQHSVFSMMCSWSWKNLEFLPGMYSWCTYTVKRPFNLQFQAFWDIQSSSYIMRLAKWVRSNTHTQATYFALPMTKNYTGLTMGAETGLHLNCRD